MFQNTLANKKRRRGREVPPPVGGSGRIPSETAARSCENNRENGVSERSFLHKQYRKGSKNRAEKRPARERRPWNYGLEGSEGQSVYAASKNAVNSLTRSWAKELGKKGVRVVGVAPGILEATGLRTLSYETALAYTRGITIDELRAGYAKTSTTPLGRSGKLTEVASTVAFLLSEKASYIHGVTLNVAGGKTRG